MITYEQMIENLKSLKEKGFIKSKRSGDTGIGKTLEDLLGIEENNLPSSNGVKTELKSARKNGSSMLTLFTKSPLPRGINSKLLSMYGYETVEGTGKKELHTTVSAINFNQLRGKPGFKLDIRDDKIYLVPYDKGIEAYWDKETLKRTFERKLPKILYVKADTRVQEGNEEFWFNEAWELSGFDFDSFVSLLRKGVILLDIRIGQYPNGRAHDHGSGFRVPPNKLDLCFSKRVRVV